MTVVIPEYYHTIILTFTTVLPHAEITGNEIRLVYEQVDAKGDAIKSAYTKAISDIEQYLNWLSESVNQYNAQLESQLKSFVSERKSKLVENAGMIESIGLPVKKRVDSPNTYAVPVKRKKPRIEKPKATSKPFNPEPVLAQEEYQDILSIMRNMVSVMEN